MNKRDSADRPEPELSAFRKQIDDIDDKIIALLKERIGIVSRVGEYKRRMFPGRCPIRPAREAEMIRRIASAFAGSVFLPAAAAAIWRMIIGASTSVESQLTMSVYAPDREHDYVWMTREYFGPFNPVVKQPHIKRVLGDVMDGKASVGIVPMLRSADTTFWWTNLIQQGPEALRIFARIPFVYTDTPGRDSPAALAIARILPEPSGDDISILVLEADHNVSQHKLQSAFTTAKLEATWVNIATLSPSVRHHLVEVKGFVTLDHPGIDIVRATLGTSLYNLNFLGAYAVPVVLNNGKQPYENKPSHVALTSA